MNWDYQLDPPPTICDKCGREFTEDCEYDDETDTCPIIEREENWNRTERTIFSETRK